MVELLKAGNLCYVCTCNWSTKYVQFNLNIPSDIFNDVESYWQHVKYRELPRIHKISMNTVDDSNILCAAAPNLTEGTD